MSAKDKETDLEVTPEMIQAGASILENQFDALPTLARDIALMIFQAMMNKRPVSTQPIQTL